VPVQRVSQEFKDISASFQTNPLNNDLIAIKNTTAIARSIRNLILTKRGERPFEPNLGSGVYDLLFENMDKQTATIIRDEIILVIENYEPRVEIIEVLVKPNYDEATMDATIQYEVVGINVPTQELTLALEPTR
jgi:phage baseplate assembly protein W